MSNNKNTPAYLLDKVAKICWDYPAIILGDTGKVFTWKDWDERSNQLANALLDMGISRQERIGVFNHSNNEYLEYEWAGWKIAAIPMLSSITPQYSLEDTKEVLNKSDITTFFIHEDFLERLERIRPDLKKIKDYIVIGGKGNVPNDMHHYETLISRYPKTRPQFDWKPQQDDDTAGTMFSGGTTGLPKIVQHSCRLLSHLLWDIVESLMPYSIPRVIKEAPQSIFEDLSKNFSPPFDKMFLELVALRASQPEFLISLLRHILELPLDVTLGIIPHFTRGTLSGISTTPLCTSWGFATMFLCHELGGCVVMPSKTGAPIFNPSEVLELIDKYKIKYLSAVDMAGGNQLLDAWDKKPDHYHLESLALVHAPCLGGLGFKKRLMEHKQILGIDHVIASEQISSASSLYISPDDKECSKSIYDLSPHVRLVDEQDKEVKMGECGRIIKDADYCMIRYYQDEELNRQAFTEVEGKRWFITGEGGILEENRRFTVTEAPGTTVRIGDKVVIVREVDNIIGTHPAVKIVGSIGIPDERLGEAVMTVIELKEGEKATEEEIKGFCKGKMEEYKIPKEVVFVTEGEIPITRYGLVRYVPLKKMMHERGYF